VEDVERVALEVLAPRGVLRVRRLSEGEVEEVRRLEGSCALTPWGRAVNRGVEECLRRRVVLAALTGPRFLWPPGPYALIEVGGRVVGVVDESGVRLDRGALRGARGEHRVVFLPLRIPELEGVLEGCVAASPSRPAHEYLLRLLGGCEGCGTLLIGCDGLRRRECL